MLHVWVLDDMKFIPDVFAGMIPCISGGTAIHDPDDPCHTSRPGAASASAASSTAITSRVGAAPITSPSARNHSYICLGVA